MWHNGLSCDTINLFGDFKATSFTSKLRTIVHVLLASILLKEGIKLFMLLSLPFTDIIRAHPDRLKYALNSPFVLPYFCSSKYRRLFAATALASEPTWPVFIDTLTHHEERIKLLEEANERLEATQQKAGDHEERIKLLEESFKIQQQANQQLEARVLAFEMKSQDSKAPIASPIDQSKSQQKQS